MSEPAHSALPNPLAKEVVRAAHAWFDVYARLPIAMIVPAIGLIGPLLTSLLALARRPGLAFVTSALGMAGIIGTAGVSMFPFIMPSSIDPKSSLTIWDASSSHLTLNVMFVAVVIFLPIGDNDMWYFAWILGVTAAAAIGVINVMWYEFQDNLDSSAPVDIDRPQKMG